MPTPTGIVVTDAAIRAELSRILADEAFAHSPRMKRFLSFVVNEALAGRADQLAEYCIGVEVFDRGSDFEPGLDPIVRNDARRLRQKLTEYCLRREPRHGEGIVIEIPKGGYSPRFLPATSSRLCAKRLSFRLAILPFESLSLSPEAALECRAFWRLLTAEFTNLSGIELISTEFLSGKPLATAGEEFGLSHAIQCSVQRTSERFRVIAALVQIQDGIQCWSRGYEFESGEVQPDFAATIAKDIVCFLGLSSQELPAAA